MKFIKSLLVFPLVALMFVACNSTSNVRTTLVEFNNVKLTDTIRVGVEKYAVLNGSSDTIAVDTFLASNLEFVNVYDTLQRAWTGFACSSVADTAAVDSVKKYCSAPGIGATGTSQYAVISGEGTMLCPANSVWGSFTMKSLMVTNSAYTYSDMENGGVGKKFASGDWFKITFTGYLNNAKTGSVDYYLADFRNGKTFLAKDWETVDLSSLGTVDKVTFTFDSSDKTGAVINTPAYACIDNIYLTQKN